MDKLEQRLKNQKIAIIILGIACAILAVCLMAVLHMYKPGGNSKEPEAEGVGIASQKNMGEYEAASSYGQVYDYIKKSTRYDGGVVYYNADVAISEEVASSEAGTYSATNIMTQGVDESDISKTDGQFIYNVTGSEIIIFDIRDGEAVEFSRLMPEFSEPSDMIRQMYLDENLLSIIVEHEVIQKNTTKSQTQVMVYDITDRANPVHQGTYWQDGFYNTSRKVGDIIYLFTNEFLEEPDKNKASAITADGIREWIPLVNNAPINYDCIYLPKSGINATIISSFSQKDTDEAIDVKMLVNDYIQTYVGEASIYLYSQMYSANRNILKISKLPYEDGIIQIGASTSLRGDLNDKFAINEYAGALRVVTTDRSDGVSNTLYVLDSDLKEQGRINNIALGEDLYACRFVGDVGYFVTFEQTDPLFTVDLSDPKNPKIVGELELPGFSEYLHLWGEDKLLGIGYHTDDNGNRQGLKLSMFDIRDPGNVTEISKEILMDFDYAPSFYDYRAAMIDPNKNLIGFAAINYTMSSDNAKYFVYTFDKDVFNKVLEEDVGGINIDRVRGHFAKDYIYVSNDTIVLSNR